MLNCREEVFAAVNTILEDRRKRLVSVVVLTYLIRDYISSDTAKEKGVNRLNIAIAKVRLIGRL